MVIVHNEFEDNNLYRFTARKVYPVKFDIDPRYEFCAIYFPCEIDETSSGLNAYGTLKQALLFFDKVFVVVPEIIFSDYFCDWIDMSKIDETLIKETEKVQSLEYKLWRDRFKKIRQFIKETRIAHDEKILIYVNPNQIIEAPLQSHFYSLPEVNSVPVDEIDSYLGEILFHSIVSDLNDKHFRELVKTDYPYKKQQFAVFKDQGEINWLYMLSGASRYEEDKMIRLATFINEYTIAPPPGVGFDSIVSSTLGIAVFLSHIMSFCIQNSVYPLTDSLYYWRLLQHKFDKLVKQHKNTSVVRQFESEVKTKLSVLGLQLLDLQLPYLNIKSFEEVLHIRQKHKEELLRFRLELSNFSNFTSTHFWSEDFVRECNNINLFKITPALNNLEKSLKFSRDKVVLEAVKNLSSIRSVTPLCLLYLSGIPIQYALAVTAGLVSLESVLEFCFEAKKIKKMNGLSYLMNLKNQFASY